MTYFGSKVFWAFLVMGLLFGTALAPESIGRTGARVVQGYNAYMEAQP